MKYERGKECKVQLKVISFFFKYMICGGLIKCNPSSSVFIRIFSNDKVHIFNMNTSLKKSLP